MLTLVLFLGGFLFWCYYEKFATRLVHIGIIILILSIILLIAVLISLQLYPVVVIPICIIISCIYVYEFL